MPATIASDVLDAARGTYLNDPLAGTYTNDKLLPHLRSAYSFLEAELRVNGVQLKNEESLHTLIAPFNELTTLPPDLVIPRGLLERISGSSDEFMPVDWVPNIPIEAAVTNIRYWTWRTDRLYFNNVTTDREVKLIYQQSYPALDTANVNLFGKAEDYLAAKTAALALLFIAQSPTLAKTANDIAENELQSIIVEQVKMLQKFPSRRKGYVPGYRR